MSAKSWNPSISGSFGWSGPTGAQAVLPGHNGQSAVVCTGARTFCKITMSPGFSSSCYRFMKHCFKNEYNQYHSIKEPAIIWSDGEREFWINGKQVTEEQFKVIMRNYKL